MSGQNTSTAVMARRAEPSDSLDDFPTPPWATRALIEHVLMPYFHDPNLIAHMRAWDPACNRGFMARPLAEYFGDVRASDIFDYGYAGQGLTADFLEISGLHDFGQDIDWIITNPPFRQAEKFIMSAWGRRCRGYAMLMRTSFMEGTGRHDRLFSRRPPNIVAQFSERVVMHKGKIVNPNVPMPVWSKKLNKWVFRKPTTATSYTWFVWFSTMFTRPGETRVVWIPPCRKQLERAGDYVGDEVPA